MPSVWVVGQFALCVRGCEKRFKHGSKKADERVKKLGYCRVHMPSVPRTGSTWFRAMFETATSQPSFSMWQGTTEAVELRPVQRGEVVNGAPV